MYKEQWVGVYTKRGAYSRHKYTNLRYMYKELWVGVYTNRGAYSRHKYTNLGYMYKEQWVGVYTNRGAYSRHKYSLHAVRSSITDSQPRIVMEPRHATTPKHSIADCDIVSHLCTTGELYRSVYMWDTRLSAGSIQGFLQ